MQCPKCQFENPEKMQFCGRCGSKLQNLCPFCEFANPPDFQFCGKCGAKLTQEEALSNIAVPKLEDMQAQLQGLIPTHLIKSMKLAEQKIVGENRLVTTLFADLSGFTPMSQELPTEVVVEKVNQCFQAITTAVYRYEGNINRFIGDETLAFFGAPLAHENDPERAVLAALDMRRAVSQLGLKISIGINTGMMYFGPIGTPQQHVEISAYGPDINLAKRLQQEAQPGQILVGEGTYRPTRRAFEFESLPPQELRGIAEPVTAYSVLKALPKPEKMRGIEGLKAEMIGREKEFADLKGRLDELLAGRGQIVSIIGEAGLGKSRLATELKEYIKDKEKAGGKTVCRILEGRCVSIGEPIGYSVFTDILRNYFQFSQEESEKERGRKIVDKMKVLFPQKPDSSTSSGQEGSEGWADIVPYIGNLLSVKFGNEWDEKVKHLPPEQVKYQICLKLRDLFLALANRKPLLFILDDLHWADNLSLDLLSLLMDELRYAPLMLLCIYRPDKEHKSWHIGAIAGGKCLDRYSEIRLQELNPPESRLLVESLLRVENLPEKIKASILDKAGGNPYGSDRQSS